MANILVITFKVEKDAIEALNKMRELDAYGDITLYEHLMIRKEEGNKYEVLESNQNEGLGQRMISGMALGGFIGVFGGPLGLLIGLSTGAVAGTIWGLGHFDFEDEFVEKVSKETQDGNIVLFAEVGEDGPLCIDHALKPYYSELLRSEAGADFSDYIDDEIEDLEEEIEDQREKLKKATVDEKEKIKAKIADLKVKRQAIVTELETKKESVLKEIKTKTKARINKLEARLENFGQSISASLREARSERLKKRITREVKKLHQLRVALKENIAD